MESRTEQKLHRYGHPRDVAMGSLLPADKVAAIDELANRDGVAMIGGGDDDGDVEFFTGGSIAGSAEDVSWDNGEGGGRSSGALEELSA